MTMEVLIASSLDQIRCTIILDLTSASRNAKAIGPLYSRVLRPFLLGLKSLQHFVLVKSET